ncbi:MAG TPA: type II toxin-antitoxin system PemK/MazF family toxin [Rhizomicrobium sp.]|jgi:mRNA interferase MazF|nr:type II toxin-antitoxin system PemK/MazF family toxin [Rhizomicrobium sp.]
MKRGDVVIVAAAGDYGKPRPAVIVQSNAFPESHASLIICQLPSELSDAPDFRIAVEPDAANGLRARSQIMADKPVTIRRERVGNLLGCLNAAEVRRMNVALGFALGLAD